MLTAHEDSFILNKNTEQKEMKAVMYEREEAGCVGRGGGAKCYMITIHILWMNCWVRWVIALNKSKTQQCKIYSISRDRCAINVRICQQNIH